MQNLNVNFAVPIKESVQSGKDFIIKGEAIHEITTRNGVFYSSEELKMAHPSLSGKPLLKDHNNSIESIVGRVQKTSFNDMGKCIMFEAKVMDKMCQEMISDGRINSVSIGAMVKEVNRETINDNEVLVPKGIDFVELSLVAVPADPNANFAQAMCESFKMAESKLTVAEPKLEIVESPKKEVIIENIKQEETNMAELEDMKKQLEESQKVIETMKAEKIAQEKAKAEAEALKVQETLKSQTEKILALEKELASAKAVTEASVSKGVVAPTTTESKNPIEGYMLERADSGKGFMIYKTDFSQHKRMMR